MYKWWLRRLPLVLGVGSLWAFAALAVWLLFDPVPAMVGVRGAPERLPDAGLIRRADLSDELALLEVSSLWGMARDGRDPPAVASVGAVEKRIVWSVAATVVRPSDKYLLIIDQGTRAMTQVREGEKLPDGSKLLQVAVNAYTVRTAEGKKRTLETSF